MTKEPTISAWVPIVNNRPQWHSLCMTESEARRYKESIGDSAKCEIGEVYFRLRRGNPLASVDCHYAAMPDQICNKCGKIHGFAHPHPILAGLQREREAVCAALDGAHWLSGDAPTRIRALIGELELAIEGKHPVQVARAERSAVGSISKAHLNPKQGPWCKEILMYSPDNLGDHPENRAMLYLHPSADVQPPAGPRTPDPTMVICPACTHQFTAIPEDVQAELQRLRDALEAELERYRWMRDNITGVDLLGDSDNKVKLWIGPKVYCGSTLEATIDAARAALGDKS